MLMLLYIISDCISVKAVEEALYLGYSYFLLGNLSSSFKGINQMVLSLEFEPQ